MLIAPNRLTNVFNVAHQNSDSLSILHVRKFKIGSMDCKLQLHQHHTMTKSIALILQSDKDPNPLV